MTCNTNCDKWRKALLEIPRWSTSEAIKSLESTKITSDRETFKSRENFRRNRGA